MLQVHSCLEGNLTSNIQNIIPLQEVLNITLWKDLTRSQSYLNHLLELSFLFPNKCLQTFKYNEIEKMERLWLSVWQWSLERKTFAAHFMQTECFILIQPDFLLW